MSWSQEISQLVTEVDQLTSSVNIKQATLDASVATAELNKNLTANNALAAANSAAQALASLQTAEGHKNTAVAVYGSLAAQQASLINAQNASVNASFAADSASSIQQQNLSGINAAALHRSPNAITSMFVYDTSKDTDGGAWTEKCQHTSWWNEPLMGKWLGAAANEFEARHNGSTVSSTELVSNGNFSNGTTGWNTLNGSGSVSDGIYAFTPTTNFGGPRQNITLVVGRTYRITADIRGNAVARLYLNGTSGTPTNLTGSTNNTTVTVYAVASSTSGEVVVDSGNSMTPFSVDNISVREVTALTTQSGDYYQSTADGRFYRLWNNVLTQSLLSVASVAFPAGVSVTSDGTLNVVGAAAQKLVVDSTGGATQFFAAFGQTHMPTISTNSDYVFSVEVKRGSLRYAGIALDIFTGIPNGTHLRYDLDTGLLDFASANWKSYGIVNLGDGWYRIWGAINTGTSVGGSRQFRILADSQTYVSDAAYNVVRDGTASLYVGRAQVDFFSLRAVEEKSGLGSTSEVFRGNKRDFPRLAGMVLDTERLAIYDLTEPGRPMWGSYQIRSVDTITAGTVTAVEGHVCVAAYCGGNFQGNGFAELLFPLDKTYLTYNAPWQINGRTVTQIDTVRNTATAIGGSPPPGYRPFTVHEPWAAAMCVLPNAPTNPITGLRIPTIAVSRGTVAGGNIAIIKHDDTVVSSSISASPPFTSLVLRPTLLSAGRSDGTWYTAANPGSLGGSFALSTRTNAQAPGFGIGNTGKLVDTGRARLLRRSTTAARAQITRVHESDLSRSLVATVGDTFNTSWMTGDIRRCFLSDTGVGAPTGGELVADGSFASGIGDWQAGTGSTVTNEAGELRVQPTSSFRGAYLNLAVATGVAYRVRLSVRVAGVNSGFIRIGSSAYTAAMSWNGGYLDTPTSTNNSVRTVDMVIVATSPTLGIGVICSTAVFDLYVDNVSVAAVVQDRSYRSSSAPITGTLTRAQLASGTSLVGYSGWSAANYLREPYSADLDFGTGEWSASTWANVPIYLRKNLFLRSEVFENSYWSQPRVTITQASSVLSPIGTTTTRLFVPTAAIGDHGVYATVATGDVRVMSVYAKQGPGNYKLALHPSGGNGRAVFNLTTGQVDANDSGQTTAILDVGDGWYRCSVTVLSAADQVKIYVADASNAVSYVADGTSGIYVWGAQLELGTTVTSYQPVTDGTEYIYSIYERSHSSGSSIKVRVNSIGRIIGELFDGTTTRTVTTTAAYNTGQWLKTGVNYTTDGSLSLLVNGREVAATRGTPLLTLNNPNAVLTIGNSFALDAPFLGSLALLKFSATVPTAEQETFMYEQEKQLFRAGSLSVLPDSGSIVDMSYDDATDRWVALSATNESYWTGLVRNSVTPVPAGSYSRIATTSGIGLTARTTTNPGVDITIPEYILREELLKRSEPQTRLNRQVAVYDYVGGFTATTTNGSTSLTSVANLTYPTSYIGARISGAGIPANTFITGVSGTTIYISAPASASASGVTISFLDFRLPAGMIAESVSSAGTTRREGSTQDYTRLYDGFVETIRFAVAPGTTTWVQIKASRQTN